MTIKRNQPCFRHITTKWARAFGVVSLIALTPGVAVTDAANGVGEQVAPRVVRSPGKRVESIEPNSVGESGAPQSSRERQEALRERIGQIRAIKGEPPCVFGPVEIRITMGRLKQLMDTNKDLPKNELWELILSESDDPNVPVQKVIVEAEKPEECP